MLLIDGYNLLHKITPRARPERLAARLADYALAHRVHIEVIFDGGGSGMPHSEWLTVRFAPDADTEIIARIEQQTDRTAMTVVSSDHAIADAARARKLKVIEAEDFAREIEEAPPAPKHDPKTGGISPAEADAWMKEFGIEEP